jgi:GNAT superfamily N-acetyltransferase
MEIFLVRADSAHPHIAPLIKALDKDLAERDGDDHAFYSQFNKLDAIKEMVIAYVNNIPVGCGAIKHFDNQTMEVKRMYVTERMRGKGVASIILKELENWAGELGCKRCVLETGIRQPEAIALYKKSVYVIIENYGQYSGKAESVCFEKWLL